MNDELIRRKNELRKIEEELAEFGIQNDLDQNEENSVIPDEDQNKISDKEFNTLLTLIRNPPLENDSTFIKVSRLKLLDNHTKGKTITCSQLVTLLSFYGLESIYIIDSIGIVIDRISDPHNYQTLNDSVHRLDLIKTRKMFLSYYGNRALVNPKGNPPEPSIKDQSFIQYKNKIENTLAILSFIMFTSVCVNIIFTLWFLWLYLFV